MKTFEITTYPICGGIAVPISNIIRAKSKKAAINEISKKNWRFTIVELFWVNGERERSNSELINLLQND